MTNDALREREAVVAWLAKREAPIRAGIRVRLVMAFLGLFAPQRLVETVAEALADMIEAREHLTGGQE